MAQYLFGNNGTTYNVELTGGVAYLDTKGFVLESYGAKGDGSTDDSAAFVAAHAAAVAAGGGVVFGAPGKTYVLDSGVTWNATRARFDGLGCTIDASSLKSGAAFTVDGPTEQYNHIYGFDNCKVVGPGEASSVTAFVFAEATGSRSSKCSFNNVHVEYFGKGFDFQTGAFLTSLFYCQVRGCGVAINCESGYSVYGENINLYGCTLFNGGTAVVVSNGDCDIHMFGTSIDFNDSVASVSGGGKVKFSGCHFEWSASASTVPFTVGEASRVVIRDSTITGYGTPAASYTALFDFPSSVSSGAEPVVVLDGNFIYNTLTTSGSLGDGVGIIRAANNYGPGAMQTAEHLCDYSNVPGWGNFELDALTPFAYISESVNTITDAHTAGSDILSLSGSYYRGGSQSLRVQKENGTGSTYKVRFVVPVTPGQFALGTRYFVRKPTAGGGDQTAWTSIYHAIVDSHLTSEGGPFIVREDLRGTESWTLTNAAMDWTKVEVGLNTTPAHLPEWCTHLIVEVNFVNHDGTIGDIYIDDFSFSGI